MALSALPGGAIGVSRRDAILALLGCLLVLAALAMIWTMRLGILADQPLRMMYVSELGAAGERTSRTFMAALLAVVCGGALVAWAARSVRAEVRALAAWTVSVSLWVSCGFFLFASQVTCTSGCPLPYGPTFVWQDFLHTLSAVLAFGMACWAMLQAAFARAHPAIATISAICAVIVGGVAATGGLFSLFRFRVDIGAWLEFIATTVAIAWVVLFGLAVAHVRWHGTSQVADSSS